MNSQPFSFPKQELKSIRASVNAHATRSDRTLTLQLNPEQSAKISRLLQQLLQSITVLGHTSDLALTGGSASPNTQALRANLQPNARQAEEAMHQLRDLRLTTSPVLTELSQSLTVLVLAADMITNGQLAGTEALGFYELLRRNADTTIRSLNRLYVVFGLEADLAL